MLRHSLPFRNKCTRKCYDIFINICSTLAGHWHKMIISCLFFFYCDYIIDAAHELTVSLSDVLRLLRSGWVSHVVHCSEPLWHSLLWYWQEELTLGLALQFPRQMFVLTISYSSWRDCTGVAHFHPAGWHDFLEVGGACRAQWPNYPIWGETRQTLC